MHAFAPAASRAQESPNPYCGVYSLYAACKLEGKQITLQSLLQPQYVGSFEGSSLAELHRAALDAGLHAEPVQNLHESLLPSLGTPAILHVKASPRSRTYDHWLLCVRATDGSATVVDPPRQPQQVSLGELATRWDGTALLVSASPIDMSSVQRHALWRLCGWAAILIVLAVGSHLVRWLARPQVSTRSRSSVRWRLLGSAATCAVLALVSGALAVAHHRLAESGFLNQAEAVGRIREAHWADFIQKLSATDARDLVGRPGVVFIDARLPGDYARGHIEGAVNIPANVNDSNLRDLIAVIPRDHHLILYCQSESCRYAKDLAPRLAENGYVRQSLLTGGWRDWSKVDRPSRER
jgi:rhodanese-related sulfurtransferase